MRSKARRGERGQAIVLVAIMLVVLFGFVGLAVDGGHAYIDRRELQAAVDAAALAAAFNYMNNSDYTQADAAAASIYAANERLYMSPNCTGNPSTTYTCAFGDPTGHSLTITAADHSIAGVSFTAAAAHQIPVSLMQVLGTGPTIRTSASATAVARRTGTNGAAIQTLSPGGCGGAGGTSLIFTGTSTTMVTGDVWSNGAISDSGQANGSVTGNVTDVCPNIPPVPLPNFTVSGSQVNGWNMPDPGYAAPALNSAPQAWLAANGATELPGTYASNPNITGGSSCYFLAGGVYDFAGGFKFNGGFISNDLRPPDEPMLTSAGSPYQMTIAGALSGNVTSIPVGALSDAIAAGTLLSVGGVTFTVKNGGVAAGATSIPVNSQSVSTTIPSGTWLAVRSPNQFWDSNGSNCGATISLSAVGGSSGNQIPGSWAVKLTALRWEPSSCAPGPVSPTCYLRESAPSMCQTVTVGNSQNFRVGVVATTSGNPANPGAQYYNLYVAQNGACNGAFALVTQFQAGSTLNVNSGTFPNPWPGSQPAPPDGQGRPLAASLPNADPAPGTPPHGDLANEGHCVNPATGAASTCPSGVTPGAVEFYIPGPGSNTICLNLQGGGDIYIFSGYQFGRVLVYEPGPEQAPPANTCPNNVAGHGLTSLIGIFYVPAADVTIVGNSSYFATIAGGVISYTASVKGNGGVSISVDPTQRAWPSAVRLTQ